MTRLLLDTNVAIWLLLGDRTSVSSRAVDALEDGGNEVALSAVSHWEIAIKRSVGKLKLEDGWSRALTRMRFDPMPITAQHAERVEQLSWHHHDPFDRLLIAQAELEGHSLVSAEDRFGAYDIDVVW